MQLVNFSVQPETMKMKKKKSILVVHMDEDIVYNYSVMSQEKHWIGRKTLENKNFEEIKEEISRVTILCHLANIFFASLIIQTQVEYLSGIFIWNIYLVEYLSLLYLKKMRRKVVKLSDCSAFIWRMMRFVDIYQESFLGNCEVFEKKGVLINSVKVVIRKII